MLFTYLQKLKNVFTFKHLPPHYILFMLDEITQVLVFFSFLAAREKQVA